MAQELMRHNPARPIGEKNTVKNSLSGIVICGNCGRHMVRRPHTKYPDMLICSEPTCNNVGAQLRVVEERILQSLKEWLGEYKISWDITSPLLNEFPRFP